MCRTYGKAQPADFDRLNELFIEMFQTIYHTDRAEGYSPGDLDRFFDGRDEWICTVSDHETIIAFLSIEVHHGEKEYIYLDDLAVTGRYRNKGIGTSLIKRAEDYAGKIHIRTLRLHVEKENSSALRLYQRLGYAIWEDQGSRYLMSKEIS